MRTLYHWTLEPRSRTVRMALAEKCVEFEAVTEPFWERRVSFLRLNPSGQVPVLIETDGSVIAEMSTIVEYVNERYTDSPSLMGHTIAERAEVRRLSLWFCEKFATEVVNPLLTEKVWTYLENSRPPNSEAIRVATHNMETHLNYIEWLVERRSFLAGHTLSVADLCAAAHLSCVDYLGAVSWQRFGVPLEWYERLKSRPCFRDILRDRVDKIPPASHYSTLDFT